MIPHDQLTRLERIRLESFAQSVSATTMTSPQRPTLNQIMDNAKVIEKFLLEADNNKQ